MNGIIQARFHVDDYREKLQNGGETSKVARCDVGMPWCGSAGAYGFTENSKLAHVWSLIQ
jgi:hypothetical protein